jgi:MoaA/NifB/PqqE/SkfB family radical SAM enzyme
MCEEHSIYKNKKIHFNRLMDFNLILEVIQETSDIGLKEIIPSTMGEPLLYPKFENIIELIKENNLKINLTTNGTFPKLGVETWGALILPVASDVKISINGSSKEVNEFIMSGINFEEQITNIKKFIQIRDEVRKKGKNDPSITFQATFLESNLIELPDLLKLAIRMNVDRFKGHHLWITHPELKNESLRRNSTSIKSWNKIVDILRNIAKKNKLKSGESIKLDNIYYINRSAKFKLKFDKTICPFLGREAWIAWDGTFNVCCAPDNLRKTLGNFGNIKKNGFLKLWNSQKYNDLIRNWGNFEICKSCNMKRPKKDIGVF